MKRSNLIRYEGFALQLFNIIWQKDVKQVKMASLDLRHPRASYSQHAKVKNTRLRLFHYKSCVFLRVTGLRAIHLTYVFFFQVLLTHSR